MVKGTATVNNLDLIEGDGLSISEESTITIANPNESEIIVFDLR
jgi:redox-sensitive bicupin YhaK (pirin superfamily)